MPVSKSEVRQLEARLDKRSTRVDLSRQTHSVFVNNMRFPAYRDGEFIRHIVDNRVLAVQTRRGWSQAVKEARPIKGVWDHIKALGEPVRVTLDRGRYY